MRSRLCFRILVLMTACVVNVLAQSDPSVCREKLKTLAATLPSYDETRVAVENGAIGYGIRQVWMDQMAAYGIKSTYLRIGFFVTKNSKNCTVVTIVYYSNYGVPLQEIHDTALLKKIKESGLESSLKTAAILDFQRTLPRPSLHSGLERASGSGYEILFDDECIPELSAVTLIDDLDYSPSMIFLNDWRVTW